MLVTGSILLAAGVLAVGLLALLFRHPRSPRWTRPELVAMLLTIPVTAMLGLGLGYLLTGGYRLLHGTGELYELGAPVAAAIVVAVLYRLSGIRGRLQAYEAAGAGTGSNAAPAAATPVLEGSPRAPSPHRPARKAAA
jgi:hypothetical protein